MQSDVHEVVRERVRAKERVQAVADHRERTIERAGRGGAGEPGEERHAGRSVRVLGNESESVEDEGPLEAVEVRKHGSDDDRRKPPAITRTKHRDGLHAHPNGFGASRAVRFAYAPRGLGLSHRDVSAGPRKESNRWPANGGTTTCQRAPRVIAGTPTVGRNPGRVAAK